ncbi:MAG: heparin lyase I family protein [Candidatus Methanoperedens sp.]|nr:heparin lyase I family protein [Candidatus Methanoperedens sp.]
MQLTFAIIAMALAYFAMPAAAETNLIANWTFNEDAGEVAADSSGNGNNVNLINGPIWTTGVNGNALQFDGTNDYAVNTSATDIPAKSPFSVVAWVNGKSFSNPRWNDIVRKEGSWAVQVTPNNKLNFEITGIQDTISDIEVPTDVWTHIAVTLEGTTVNFYKNGVLADTRTQTNVPDAGLNTIDIGGYTSWGTYLNGALDEVKIYNRSLSAAEINADYLNSSISTIPASAPTSVQLPQAEPTPARTKTLIQQVMPTPVPTPAPKLTTNGKLLFDGSFAPTDRWVSKNGAFGNWKGYSCVPQSDSIVVVPASSLPGGRTGYAAKFTIKPGSAYDCNGNQHNQIISETPDIPNVAKEAWYGWSQMLDANWQFDKGSYAIGMAEAYENPCDTCAGSGFRLGSSVTGKIEITNNCKGSATESCFWKMDKKWNFQPGVWEDWMYHIKWTTDNTGFIEVYKNGQLAWSKYNHPTKTTLYEHFTHRVGLYRSSKSSTTQVVYILNPKIGTTRADVEYRG